MYIHMYIVHLYIDAVYRIPKLLIPTTVSPQVTTQGKEAEIGGVNTAYNCL